MGLFSTLRVARGRPSIPPRKGPERNFAVRRIASAVLSQNRRRPIVEKPVRGATASAGALVKWTTARPGPSTGRMHGPAESNIGDPAVAPSNRKEMESIEEKESVENAVREIRARRGTDRRASVVAPPWHHVFRRQVPGVASCKAGPIPASARRDVSPYGTSWHLMALRDRTKFSE
jgi:hypothetical protein